MSYRNSIEGIPSIEGMLLAAHGPKARSFGYCAIDTEKTEKTSPQIVHGNGVDQFARATIPERETGAARSQNPQGR